MAFHVADIPTPFYCYVKDEFLYDLTKGFGEFTPCLAYGISSLEGRAWGISILLNNGAMVQHVPLHALTTKPDSTHNHPLDHLQVWSCYGHEFATHSYSALSEMPIKAYLKGGIWENGRYLFSACPINDQYSLTPDQHKHFNFIELDCGSIGALPGNRMFVYDSSFVTIPKERPKYLTNSHVWYVECLESDDPFDETISPETSL